MIGTTQARALKLFLLVPVAMLLIAGCATSKVTSTERTAVEMALLSQSAEDTLSKLDDGTVLYYDRFWIDEEQFQTVDEEFILSTLKLFLLRKGMKAVDKAEDADVLVYPRAANAAMDESKSMIGIPSLPIVIPGAGSVETPEVALYKQHTQAGVNRMGLYGIDAKDRSLAFDFGTEASRKTYTRWTLLFFINFATTNLAYPYHTTYGAQDPTKDKKEGS